MQAALPYIIDQQMFRKAQVILDIGVCIVVEK